jgi:hypothetical protein
LAADRAKRALNDRFRDLFWDQSRGRVRYREAVAGGPARLVRSLQIIVGMMALGTLAFAAVAGALRAAGRGPPADEGPLLSYLAIGLAVMSIFMWQLLPRAVATRGRRQMASGTFAPPARGWLAELTGTEDGRLRLLYQTCTILGAATLEGAALFACVVHLVAAAPAILVLGVGLAGLMLLAEFPTRGRADRWVDAQRRLLADERSLPVQ